MHVKLNKPVYEGMNLLRFQKEFGSEEKCWEWLFRTRWPEGFCCPGCGHSEYTLLEERRLCLCSACRYQASVTAGTIFHKTKTPLLKWFWLVYRMATSKTGVSIAEMRRELEIKDYKTIWAMAHKIRKGMADRDSHYRLAGLVEVDESLFGPSASGKPGRGAQRKSVVIVAVSTWLNSSGKEEPGFAHAFVAQDASADTIEAILNRLTVPVNEVKPLITSLRSDGWRSYQKVSKKLGVVHYRAILSDPKDSMRLLPWTHRLIANAKAVISGPHRGVADKHLQRYLSEVCYRFNRRFWPQESFHRLLNACATTSTVTCNELMAPNGAAEQSQ
jgi:ISXO2-like transposase domain/Transposase zinc-ribbon domain